MGTVLRKIVVILLLCIDLSLNIVSMSTLAPDILTRIAFISLGVAFVVLALPSYIIGNKSLWFILVVLSTYLNVSFVLAGTTAQDQTITLDNDAELHRIDTEIQDAEAMLANLNQQQIDSYTQQHLDRLDGQINRTLDRIDTLRSQRLDRQEFITTGQASVLLRASDVFYAIPRSWTTIPFWFFLLTFIALQMGIVTFGVLPSEKKQEPLVVTKKVRQWVMISWTYARNGRSQKIVKKDSFFKIIQNRAIDFTEKEYDRILAIVEKAGFVDGDIIKELDQDKVMIKIQEELR